MEELLRRFTTGQVLMWSGILPPSLEAATGKDANIEMESLAGW